jgi:photosystem II stability/assembly factor-like uncharacterized protein
LFRRASPVRCRRKVYASPTAEPSTPPWVIPFEGIDFIDRSHGWEVTLEQAGLKVDVARTSDGGATWSAPVTARRFFLGDIPLPRFGVRFANLNDGWLFPQGVYATTDGGATWTETSLQSYVYDVAVVGSSVWAMTEKGMFRSEAGSTVWTAMSAAPIAATGPNQLIRVNEKVAFIVHQAQFETAIYRTSDGGATWKNLAAPCTGYTMPVATLDGIHVWMVCGSEPGAGEQAKWTYVSVDGGGHWTVRAYDDGLKSSGSMPIVGYAKLLALTSATTGFMANDRGDLYKSSDAGATWKASGPAYASEGFFNDLQFVDSSTGWFSGTIEG